MAVVFCIIGDTEWCRKVSVAITFDVTVAEEGAKDEREEKSECERNY